MTVAVGRCGAGITDWLVFKAAWSEANLSWSFLCWSMKTFICHDKLSNCDTCSSSSKYSAGESSSTTSGSGELMVTGSKAEVPEEAGIGTCPKRRDLWAVDGTIPSAAQRM